jgi:hypothetical protein
VGFGAGLAAGGLSADAKARMAELPLLDLLDKAKGRYTMMPDDGISGYWGLDALQARAMVGPKPYAQLRGDDGSFQSERVIFADTGTGATVMKLTQIPYPEGSGDELIYFGKSAWNADGTLMTWVRSAKAGLWGPSSQRTTDAYGPMVVKADGTAPRLPFEKGKTLRPPICSPTRPDIAYAGRGANVVELNLRTGQVVRTIGQFRLIWHLKVSPDDRYVMGKNYDGFWIYRVSDGRKWDVPLERWEGKNRGYPVHDSYRFLPADTDWIMYWYEPVHPGGGLNKEGFRLRNFKTGQEKIVPFRFDWNHGDVGRYLGFHATPYVTRWNGQTFEPRQGLRWPTRKYVDNMYYYDLPHNHGGYAVHWPDDQLWGLSVIYKRFNDQKYLSDVSKVFAKPLPEGGRVNRFRVCYTNLWGGRRCKDRSGQQGVVLARPNGSPDGTKLLFNSNVFARCGVYMVVTAKPGAPVNVSAEAVGGGVKVSWQPPKHCREIAGYHVYRSDESGAGFELLTARPVAGTSWVDATARTGRAYFYAVRSVEHSRLESALSAEAAVGDIGDVPLRIFCEADDAIAADLDAPSPDAIWMNYDGTASNLHYVWQRRPDRPGSVKLTVDVPRAGQYHVIARMKGKGGAAFTIGGQEVSIPPSAQWTWARSSGTVRLPAGRQAIEIASSKYGSCGRRRGLRARRQDRRGPAPAVEAGGAARGQVGAADVVRAEVEPMASLQPVRLGQGGLPAQPGDADRLAGRRELPRLAGHPRADAAL